MARAAIPRRLIWRVATITAIREETPTARTLTLDVPGWPGHLPGQHVAVRLTAEDGYTATRDYSIANAADGDRLELTVQRLDDGEVSPYLALVAGPGDQFEVRGPVGGWFVWDPRDTAPLLLLAGGSGIVPLMSMIRSHHKVKSQVPARLIYSVRTPADGIYASELSERTRNSALTLTYLYTRATPPAAAVAARRDTLFPGDIPDPAGPYPRGTRQTGRRDDTGRAVPSPPPAVRAHAGRLTAAVLAAAAFPPAARPAIFVCGPYGFVETASTLLIAAGHPAQTIKTERFGPT